MKALQILCLCLAPYISLCQATDSVSRRQVDSLFALSRALTDQQQYDSAMAIAITAEKISLKVFGDTSTTYADCQFNLGRICFFSGHYEQAEGFYLSAKEIRINRLGKEHKDYVRVLNNLAIVYRKMGQYEPAEKLYLEARDIQEQKLGKNDSDYPQILNNLAILYNSTGRFRDAENILIEVKTIRENTPGKTSSAYASSLDNLAVLYYYMDSLVLAEQYYLEAKNIRAATLGPSNRYYASSLNNLALLYYKMGRYETAKAYLIQAEAIWRKSLGVKHPDYTECLNNLGLVYQQMGQYELADSFLLEAKNIREQLLGRFHPDYAASVNNLAILYTQLGRFEAAAQFWAEAMNITNTLLIQSARFLSAPELSAYVQLYQSQLDHYYSFALQTHGKLPAMNAGCYNNGLFHKGFLLNISSQISKIAATDTLATEWNNLVKSYHRRLAVQYAKPIHQRLEVEELETKANAAEKELARSVAGFGEAIRQVHWQEVQATLQPGEAAVEFIHYRYWYALHPSDSVMYAALVQRQGDAYPQMVPLFEERQLAQLLPAIHDMDRIDAFYKPPVGQTVYALVWQPLAPLLEGVSTVYCAPSGLLHRLNLGAIPVNPDRVIADKYQLVLLGSTRQLVGRNGCSNSSNTAVLFGGIQYDSDTISRMPALPDLNRGLEQNTAFPIPGLLALVATAPGGPKPWKFLPATATEVNNIEAMLSNNGFSTQLRTGSIASEEVFKQLGRSDPAPRILHLATHGYFFPDTETNQQQNHIPMGEQDLVFRDSDNPMIRSGLILAGANQTWTGCQAPAQSEDGILTAYEISQQNLSNTELVVLSACETGLGQIQGNEGVYGLQRAFKIAGARYLIMSLWQVNDQKTGELMIEFYRNYLDGKLPVPEAFRAAQRTMRTRYPGSPYVWAGFVLVE